MAIDKRARRARIKDMAGKRSKRDTMQDDAPPVHVTSLPLVPATYWMTRDRLRGKLADEVRVWWVRPEPAHIDGDVAWFGVLPNGDSALYERWSMAKAQREVRSSVPEDAIQCVRVG